MAEPIGRREAFLKPQGGLIVKDPITLRALPAEGAKVVLTPYWKRRLRDGDVTEIVTGTPVAASLGGND
jgi:hypothetical protein